MSPRLLVFLLALACLATVGCAHRPGHRHAGIKHPPRKVAMIAKLPSGHRVVHVKGRRYFVHKGVYYAAKGPRGYTVFKKPLH